MENIWDHMRAAISQAKSTFSAADSVADTMADLLVGRLKHVRPSVLAKLKRELRSFDMHRKEWRQP